MMQTAAHKIKTSVRSGTGLGLTTTYSDLGPEVHCRSEAPGSWFWCEESTGALSFAFNAWVCPTSQSIFNMGLFECEPVLAPRLAVAIKELVSHTTVVARRAQSSRVSVTVFDVDTCKRYNSAEASDIRRWLYQKVNR